jgi:hypothetical protein
MAKKPPPNRTTDASCFVRMAEDERALMEKAIAKQLADAGIDDAKLTLGKFLLGAGVREARRILGVK